MIFSGLVAIISLLTICHAYEFKEINNTLLLGELTLPIAQKNISNLVMYFHDPNCLPCKHFLDEYHKAATKLAWTLAKPHSIRLAYADVSMEKSLIKTYNIEYLPTIFFFKNGELIEEYKGPLSRESVYKWVYSYYRVPNKDFERFEIYDVFGDKDLALIYRGYLNEDNNEKILAATRKYSPHIEVYVNNNEKFIEENGLDENSLKLLSKMEPETYQKLSLSSYTKTIESYIEDKVHALPDFLDEDLVQKIENIPRAYFCYFMKEGVNDLEQRKAFYKAKDQLSLNPITTCRVDVTTSYGATFARLLGIKESEVPALGMLDTSTNITKKYKYTGEITVSTVRKFCEDALNERIDKFYLSEQEDADSLVKDKFYISKITRGNFFKAKNSDKPLLLLYCSPLEPKCRQFDNTYKSVAYQLRKNEDLIVGEWNVHENDVDAKIEGYPLLVWYSEKYPEGIVYKGSSYNINYIKDWLKVLKVKFDD